MQVTFLRSSSIGAYNWCPHKYGLEFVLGWRQPANQKAVKGNITHKALELLARRKLAEQQGQSLVKEDELGIEMNPALLTPEYAIEAAYAYYSNPERSEHTWSQTDRRDCEKWMRGVLDWGDGEYNPLNQDVVAPEQYFDLEIRRPWSSYRYVFDGGKVFAGNLRIKGAVDLVTRIDANTIHYVDYKTGQRKDWNTGQPKDYDKLRDDDQLLLYFYALTHLYPGQDVMMTIFFVRDGGPFTVYFGPEDLHRAEHMLEKYFFAIREDTRPRLIRSDPVQSWKCKRLCQFFSEKMPGSDMDKCQFIKDEIIALGMSRVVSKYADLDNFGKYGSGGGAESRE